MASRNGFLALLLLVLISVACSHAAKRVKPKPAVRERFSEDLPEPTRDDDFDWQLVKAVFSKEHKNTAVSTFSVKYLLNMLYEGSSDISETRKELRTPLGRVQNQPPNVVQAIGTIQSNPEQLLSSSAVFADQQLEISSKYATTINSTYKADVVSVNFQHPEEAARSINRWASEGTRGLIPQLVTPENIVDSVLLLSNTLYFKGLWSSIFSETATQHKPFYTGSGRSVEVPFMKQINDHYFAESTQLDASVLRLTYDGARFAMILILPHESSDMRKLLNAITADAIHQVISSLEEVEVKVELPRFHIDYSASLKEPLQQAGIRRIFQDNAELSGITSGSSLSVKVSDVFQRTVIVVDEKGSTAAAASGSSLVFTMASEPEKFVANRPFLFFIEEESTGTLLFAGKVEDPSEYQDTPHVWQSKYK